MRWPASAPALEPIAAAASVGDNDFAGRKTVRSHNLLAKTRALDDLICDPRLIAIVQGVLGRRIQISITALIQIHSGETEQPY